MNAQISYEFKQTTRKLHGFAIFKHNPQWDILIKKGCLVPNTRSSKSAFSLLSVSIGNVEIWKNSEIMSLSHFKKAQGGQKRHGELIILTH